MLCVDAILYLAPPREPKGQTYDKYIEKYMRTLMSVEELVLLAIILKYKCFYKKIKENKRIFLHKIRGRLAPSDCMIVIMHIS